MKNLKITLFILSFLFLIPIFGGADNGISPLDDMDFPITTCSLD